MLRSQSIRLLRGFLQNAPIASLQFCLDSGPSGRRHRRLVQGVKLPIKKPNNRKSDRQSERERETMMMTPKIGGNQLPTVAAPLQSRPLKIRKKTQHKRREETNKEKEIQEATQTKASRGLRSRRSLLPNRWCPARAALPLLANHQVASQQQPAKFEM